MIRVSSAEFGREPGRYRDLAQTEPVLVADGDDNETVMISAKEYRRLKRRDRRVYGVGELPQETVEAIRRAEVDPKYAYLDDLIKDWKP